VNLAWNSKNKTRFITALEQLIDLINQKNLSIQKTVDLIMESISQNKDKNFLYGNLKNRLFKRL